MRRSPEKVALDSAKRAVRRARARLEADQLRKLEQEIKSSTIKNYSKLPGLTIREIQAKLEHNFHTKLHNLGKLVATPGMRTPNPSKSVLDHPQFCDKCGFLHNCEECKQKRRDGRFAEPERADFERSKY